MDTTRPSRSLTRPRSVVPILLALALSLVWLMSMRMASATPPTGVTGTPLASGNLSEVIRAKFKQEHSGFGDGTDVSRVMVVRYDVVPGGSFGWHQHGGPVWVIVADGTLTLYSGEDPECHAHMVTEGNGFLDPGDHTHIAFNHGDEPVVVYAVFMLPEGGAPRIDVPDPGNCSF